MTAQSLDFQVSPELRGDLKKWRTRALAIGVFGALSSGAGLLISPFQFYRSYLWAYLFVVGLAVGSLA